jgi:serine/threonine protein kinase
MRTFTYGPQEGDNTYGRTFAQFGTTRLPEKLRANAEHLIAELINGQRTPHEVLTRLTEVVTWDRDYLAQLLQQLRESSRAGRLSDQDFGTLTQLLNCRPRPTADHDPDPTEELDPQPLPAAQTVPANVATMPVELLQGCILRDRYVLGEPVARGGMSIVFRARDLRRDVSEADSHEIAIKVLRDDLRTSGSAIARLKREFRQTQALRHAGVVRMLDLDCDRDVWFISMELLEGSTLKARLRSAPAGPLDVAEAMRIASVCAEILAYAHQQGTPHGDFKPGNVFLENSGAIKVLDFGAAPEIRASPAEAPAESCCISRVATRSYASPEVLAGQEPESLDDVFSFACVVYELISGQHPFGHLPSNEARDAAIVAGPLSQLSPGQFAALQRGLAWTRAERPATVEELMQSLVSDGGTATAEPAPGPSRLPSRVHLLPWQWLAVPVIAVSLIAFWRMRSVNDNDLAARAVRGTPVVRGAAHTVTTPVVEKSALGDSSTTEPQPLEPLETSAPSTSDAAPATAPMPVAARTRAQISADSASIVVSENAFAAVILLRREGNLASPASITWRLSDGSARAGKDFDGPLTGTARFLPGQTIRAIYVPLIDDAAREVEESFSLRLSSRSASIGPTDKVTITIVDDDQQAQSRD